MPSLFYIFCWLYFGANDAANKCPFFQLWYMRTGMIITLLSSFHSRLICIWSEASAYVMANTRSFMIFLFQVYWIDAFGIWSDINHYIYILSFMLFLVNWGAWHMQWRPTFPSQQSNLISCTWLLTGENVAIRALCFFFNFVILCSSPQKNLVSGTLWCSQSPAFSPLVLFLQFLVFSVIMANCSDISSSWAIWHMDWHGPLHVYCRVCYY
jgi:hypothetical protein